MFAPGSPAWLRRNPWWALQPGKIVYLDPRSHEKRAITLDVRELGALDVSSGGLVLSPLIIELDPTVDDCNGYLPVAAGRYRVRLTVAKERGRKDELAYLSFVRSDRRTVELRVIERQVADPRFSWTDSAGEPSVGCFPVVKCLLAFADRRALQTAFDDWGDWCDHVQDLVFERDGLAQLSDLPGRAGKLGYASMDAAGPVGAYDAEGELVAVHVQTFHLGQMGWDDDEAAA